MESMHSLQILPALKSFDANGAALILAYLDPGSGSFILQLIIAGAAGILFSLRGYWSKLISRFTKRGDSEPAETDDKNEKE